MGDKDSRMDLLESTIQEQDAAIHHLYATVQAMARGDSQTRDDPHDDRKPMRDRVWACANCSARLGLYDETKDQLRVRYKDFVVYITPGKGGTVKVPCRRCGEENRLEDTRGTD